MTMRPTTRPVHAIRTQKMCRNNDHIFNAGWRLPRCLVLKPTLLAQHFIILRAFHIAKMHLAYVSLLLAPFTCLLASKVTSMANTPTAGKVVDLPRSLPERDMSSAPPTQDSDSVLESRQTNDTLPYIVAPNDMKNDTMTKEVDAFLRTQTTTPDGIRNYTLPGSAHIVFWGNVILTAEAASAVSFPQPAVCIPHLDHIRSVVQTVTNSGQVEKHEGVLAVSSDNRAWKNRVVVTESKNHTAFGGYGTELKSENTPKFMSPRAVRSPHPMPTLNIPTKISLRTQLLTP